MHEFWSMNRFTDGFKVMIDLFVDRGLSKHNDSVIGHDKEGQYLTVMFVLDHNLLFQWTLLPREKIRINDTTNPLSHTTIIYK